MKNKFKTLSLAAAVVVAGAASATAAVFDFTDLVDNTSTGIGESSWDTSAVAGGWTVGGITLNASALLDYSAYLDSNTAGLGVCKVIGTVRGTANQCKPGNDDNVQIGENLLLSFSKEVQIDSITLRDAQHNLYTIGSSISFLGDTASGIYTVGNNLATLGTGFLWNFSTGRSGEFYISSITVSAVPIPAAGLMLLTGLGGLFAARRRKKA